MDPRDIQDARLAYVLRRYPLEFGQLKAQLDGDQYVLIERATGGDAYYEEGTLALTVHDTFDEIDLAPEGWEPVRVFDMHAWRDIEVRDNGDGGLEIVHETTLRDDTTPAPDAAAMDEIHAYLNQPGPWSGADACEAIAQIVQRTGRLISDDA